MVAGYSSASPGSWRPTARTLGSLFAGSAMALTGHRCARGLAATSRG